MATRAAPPANRRRKDALEAGAQPPAEARPGARRYDPAETRTRVLEAAYLLFGTRGYANTGTADIAAQADVSEGSIFYHFGSKRALLVELGKLHGQKMVEAMQGDDPLDSLSFELTLNRCFDFAEANNMWEEAEGQRDCPSSPRALKKNNPDAEPFFLATKEIVCEWTRTHLKAVAARHGASPIDIEVSARLIFALVAEAMHVYFDPASTPELKARARAECIRFCADGAGHPALDGRGPRA